MTDPRAEIRHLDLLRRIGTAHANLAMIETALTRQDRPDIEMVSGRRLPGRLTLIPRRPPPPIPWHATATSLYARRAAENQRLLATLIDGRGDCTHLAKLAGVSATTISSWRAGRHLPGVAPAGW
jgi:hypothetical protein